MYGLDLQLILTNALGFLILVFVLRKLAWGRLLGAIDERRATIQREVDAVAKLRADAEKLRGDYETRLSRIEAEARQRLQEAIHEGERIASEIKEEARAEVRAMMTRAEERLRIEQAKAVAALREQIVDMTILAAERVLRDTIDSDRQRRLVRDFLDEIEAARA